MKQKVLTTLGRIGLWALRKQAQKSNALSHAKREFLAVGYDPDEKDGPNKWIQENLLDLLSVFHSQGHSGFSASYCRHAFNDLAGFEPLAPLRGDPAEWVEIGNGEYQNNRCSHVFKGPDGRAYDIDGRIFREPDGSCFTSRDSRVFIEFPYTPKREYVDVPARGAV